MRFAPLLLAGLALAGCGETATGNAAGAANAVVENATAENGAAPVVAAKGWNAVFAMPATEALALFEKIALRPGAYEEMGGMMMSHGDRLALADDTTDKGNWLSFTASGDAKTLTGVAFDVAFEDEAVGDASRKRAIEMIGNALRSAGVEGEAVVQAALTPDAKPTTGSVAGANYAVVRKDARTTITFTKQSN